MREEFEKLAASGKINRQHIEPLVQLAQGGYCMHRSWGFGKITTVDVVFARFTIDFENKPQHSMDLSFAAESLKPIPSDHILARKASDLNSLRQMAALNHLDLIKLVLQSYSGKATVDQIQQVLVPDVITEDWKKWWEVAKRELKKDGHFQVPLKKSEPIVYQDEEISLKDRLLGGLRTAKGLKARVAVATELLKNLEDLTDAQAAVEQAVSILNADITSHQRTQPGLALEGIFIRDDLRQAIGAAPQEGEVTIDDIWAQNVTLNELLEQIPNAKHKRALLAYKEANPEHWAEGLLSMLNSVPAKLCGECANLLIQEGKLDEIKDLLRRLISQHQASTELLLWLAKERSDAFADILGPEVFRAMLTAIERDQFNEKKSNRLRDFIVDDRRLLLELIGSADIEVIRDLTRALKFSSIFDDMDKRSLLARIVKNYPAIQSMISSDQNRQEQTFLVSWESLDRRKKEYDELVKRKIPANSKEIAVARSYGDLRENHEYKSAKEMQKLLLKRKAELESEMARARGTDFANPRTDAVSVGTVVELVDLTGEQHETFNILGAWDSNPEQGVISYQTYVAQALLNQPVGSEVEIEMEGQRKKFRIESIKPYVTVSSPQAVQAEGGPSEA